MKSVVGDIMVATDFSRVTREIIFGYDRQAYSPIQSYQTELIFSCLQHLMVS